MVRFAAHQRARNLLSSTSLMAGLVSAGLISALAAFAVPAAAQSSPQAPINVKIGVLNDQSGVYADFGGKWSVEAAKLAVEEMKPQLGNINVEIVTADHQNKPDLASNIASHWYDVDGVDMITELTTSSVALAVQDVTRQKKKINFVVGAATARLTGDSCSPYGFHWAYDTRSLAVGTGAEVVKTGGDSWFFLTADYAFGHQLEKDTADIVKESGGKVLGAVRHPLNTNDFSSFLLQAQASKAKIVGLANAGLDTVNSVKQAAEFGLVAGGQRLAGMLVTLAEIHGLGLQAAQGLVLTEAYYWDRDDRSRALAKRFQARTGRPPNMIQAGTYSSVIAYLKAVRAAGTKDPDAIAAKIRELPVNDDFATGKVLANGRFVHDMYLFQVKSPAESKGPWDYYKLLGTIPGEKAYFTLAESGCKPGH